MKKKLSYPFNEIYENYLLSKNRVDKKNIGKHWDEFQEDFEKVILNTKPWKNFLRNSLSIGFNDNLHEFGQAKYNIESKSPNGWELRKQGNFSNLIEDTIKDKKINDHNLKFLHSLFAFCGTEFVINNLQSSIGSPTKTTFKIDYAGYKKYSRKEFFCNNHDLSDVYHFFIIDSHVKNLSESLTLLEIGAGYGGLISKIKKNYKNIKCILIDLPETLTIQTYYLTKEFPNSKFLFLKDLENYKEKIFNMNFDFLILPFWEIKKIPSSYVNLIINVRSMMEMTTTMLDFYFKHIQRIVLEEGIFVCINRYKKGNIILKEYPFDLYWKILLSQVSHIQNHVHQLILQRQKSKNPISISETLKNFPQLK